MRGSRKGGISEGGGGRVDVAEAVEVVVGGGLSRMMMLVRTFLPREKKKHSFSGIPGGGFREWLEYA